MTPTDQRLARDYLATLRAPAPIVETIDARDPMWRTIDRHRLTQPEAYRVEYFRAGHEAAQTLFGAMRRAGVKPDRAAVLEFGAGFGRVTRHLVAHGANVTVCDIDADAVAFMGATFGVASRVSTVDPALKGPFDAILVASVLNHLPEARFDAWLDVFSQALTPDGVLLISTHDPSLLPNVEKDGDYTYVPQSESDRLSPDEYGTAFVDASRVERALRAAGFTTIERRPRGLWFFQDLWLATRRPQPASAWRDPSAVRGRIERLRVGDDGALVAQGWGASLDGGPLASLELRIDAPDGTPIGGVEGGRSTPEQAKYHGRADFADAGWRAASRLVDPVSALWLVAADRVPLDVRWLDWAPGRTVVVE